MDYQLVMSGAVDVGAVVIGLICLIVGWSMAHLDNPQTSNHERVYWNATVAVGLLIAVTIWVAIVATYPK